MELYLPLIFKFMKKLYCFFILSFLIFSSLPLHAYEIFWNMKKNLR
jgi:hypothetical protein